MKIKEKIKNAKNKAIDWCVDHTGEIAIGVTALAGTAFAFSSGLVMGTYYTLKDKSLSQAQHLGSIQLENYIRDNVPDAANLIDEHFEENDKKLLESKE